MANQANLPLAGHSQTFTFNNNQIRIIEQNGEPWFVAVDVCRVLGISNVTDALRPLNTDENTLGKIEGIRRGNPKTNITSESGLYKLIMRSNKPGAKVFQDWITCEVLPAIHKTGSYSTAPQAPAIRDKSPKYLNHPNYELASQLAAKAAQAVFEAALVGGEGWLKNKRRRLTMS